MIERERIIERERLIELLDEACISVDDEYGTPSSNQIADYLLDKGVIVLPCKKVWYIVNRNTEFECVMSANIEDLPLYIVKNLGKYKYYERKEEALKECETK